MLFTLGPKGRDPDGTTTWAGLKVPDGTQGQKTKGRISDVPRVSFFPPKTEGKPLLH